MLRKMKIECKKNTTLMHILILTLIYIAAHWFLLVATGKWWDDWVYADHNVAYIKEVFRQSSLPLQAYVNISIWSLPYRYIVFLLFYLGGFLVYGILRKIELFSEDICFWITALYFTIPINDARITFICFNYTFELFLFWLAFYMVVIWKKKAGLSKIVLRVLSLLVLLFSFNTESIMLMTLLILLYLYYDELKTWTWNCEDIPRNIGKIPTVILQYIDFIIAPILFYIMSKVLFPGYGVYAGHGYVKWNNLFYIILNSPFYAVDTLKKILLNYTENINSKTILLVLLLSTLLLSIKRILSIKSVNIEFMPGYKKILFMLLGIFSLFIGMFPYLVKRGNAIETIGTSGRDSLLLGIGMAFLIFFVVYFLFAENTYKYILLGLIVLGIIHFNDRYLEWQLDYYYQLQISDEISENNEILNNNTFLCFFEGNYPSFYQLNGNAWMATGEQTRYFMGGIDDIPRLIEMNKDAWVLNAYMMRNYDYNDKIIDGVIFVNNESLSDKNILEMKWKELTNPDDFQSILKENKDITYVKITPEQSNRIIQAYKDDELTEENIDDYIK